MASTVAFPAVSTPTVSTPSTPTSGVRPASSAPRVVTPIVLPLLPLYKIEGVHILNKCAKEVKLLRTIEKDMAKLYRRTFTFESLNRERDYRAHRGALLQIIKRKYKTPDDD